MRRVKILSDLKTSYGAIPMGSQGSLSPIPLILKPMNGESFFRLDEWEENIYIRVTEDEYEDYQEELKIDLQKSS